MRRHRFYLRMSGLLAVAPEFTTRTQHIALPLPHVTISPMEPFKAYTTAALRLDIVDVLPSWSRSDVARGLRASRERVWLQASRRKFTGQPRMR